MFEGGWVRVAAGGGGCGRNVNCIVAPWRLSDVQIGQTPCSIEKMKWTAQRLVDNKVAIVDVCWWLC